MVKDTIVITAYISFDVGLIQVGVGHWSYFQIAGCQPARMFQTRYARFQMLKNVTNQFKILNVC